MSQQGRVVVEADSNEAQEILTEETRKEALDFVGPAGTPDDGYKIIPLVGPPVPFDFGIGAGTMYVGGMRVSLPEDARYSNQPDWLYVPDISGVSQLEHVYLRLREQEVSAVEDRVLREVALGGPDTAQRTRLIQRIERRGVTSSTCAGAMEQTIAAWESKGLFFDPKTMRLGSHIKLRVQFTPPPDPPNLCAPEVLSGYLGAENQLFRVQVAAPAVAGDPPDKVLWAQDNASALYRIAGAEMLDPAQKLIAIDLAEAPVDAHHFPRAGQIVEALGPAAQLESGEEIAELWGVTLPIVVDYDPAKRRIVIQGDIDQQMIVKYVRIWEERLDLVAGAPIPLGSTGVRVTFESPAGEPFVAGDYWLIGLRPSTPDTVYPKRLLTAAQPPDGPREWVCPLAVLDWTSEIAQVKEDCRKQFQNLVALSKKLPGCCTVSVSPEDLVGGTTLQGIIDGYIPLLLSGASVAICLQAGEYELSEPLRLMIQHNGLRIEGCHGQARLVAAAGAANAFLDGLIVVAGAERIRLRGLVLAPPNVDFDAAGGMLAGHTTAALNTASAGAIDFRGLTVSIGLRIVSSRRIEVHDCAFELGSVMSSGPKSFYAGIFASGVCSENTLSPPPPSLSLHAALDVQRCMFSSAGMLGSADHNAFGFIMTPSSTFQLGLLNTIVSGGLVQPRLDNVLFRDNTFRRLNAAVFLSAETGLVRLEDNNVTDCYAGFWSVSLHALTRTDDLLSTRLDDAVNPPTPAMKTQLIALRNDPILTVGSTIPRAFPPPQDYSGWFPTSINPADGSLDSLHSALTSIEKHLVNRLVTQATDYLDLCVTNNEIRATSPCSAALAIWDTEPGTNLGPSFPTRPGNARVSNNRLVGTSDFTVAAVVTVHRCTVTGNVITNSSNPASTVYSLVVLGQEAGPRVAVTGNVLTQEADLPARGGGLPEWATLNSLG